MRSFQIFTVALALCSPTAAWAQAPSAGQTQPRDGLGDSSGPTPFNASPAGSVNATTGPQSRPAYPSGSSTPNPGAAFVRDMPVPATGQLAKSPGEISTTQVGPGGAVTKEASPGVGEAQTNPKP